MLLKCIQQKICPTSVKVEVPHAWQENSCHSVNIVQAQVHASDESPGLSPVRYLEGHVQYLSRSTMQINHMLYNDAIIILNDKIEYD